MSKRKTFNVLSIDGGGIRGIIPARILQHIEEQTKKKICNLFDLIAGTSTGGLLALGLSMEGNNGQAAHKAEDLVNIYKCRGREIFDRSLVEDALSAMSEGLRPDIGKWVSRAQEALSLTGNLFDEKYPHEGLTRVLNCYFGDALLGSALTRTMVTCYDIHERKPVFLKSWRGKYANVRMTDAARATSAAPTYFEPHQFCIDSEKRALIDGGVYINTPVVSAYAEAVRLIENCEDLKTYNVSDIFVLSLGTGELTRKIKYDEAQDWGITKWALPLLSCIFDGVSKAADYQMEQMLGSCRYIRLQTSLGKGRGNDDMDDVKRKNIDRLKCRADELMNDQRFQDVLEWLRCREAQTSE